MRVIKLNDRLRRLVAGLALSLLTSPVMACGGVLDVVCNLQHGGMSPENLGRQGKIIVDQGGTTAQKAVQDVANALNELQANLLTGPILEQAIRASRDTAINGSAPIPDSIRRDLTGYASEESMNQVRFKIGDNGFVNLARLLEQGGAANAVTLIDVVVFRDQGGAADPSLWAHELTHVDQYRNWGVNSFAVHYSRNANSVEDEAYEKGNAFFAWAQRERPGREVSSSVSTVAMPIPAPEPMPMPGGMPSGAVTQPCGCWGPTTGFNPNSNCASGSNVAVGCTGFCSAGGRPYGWVCQ
ncbi:DUF4157 domain-containing protein [Pseudomonas veronii]|jgi:hypothetical protein|uniref:eCIS core domain-containing protein n=1 Tax=Pseudomonas TaxID=286 RepID=UPI0018E72863|nr:MULTISPECIES: DUF4157 domain-containing protein [Pseudomonas]MBJ2180009.1 DUF4157 domain-containing protein [Pseudomonas veronii]MDB1113877.1 DUF4157 domain-containing protein [Pseudomonas extremaustralis]